MRCAAAILLIVVAGMLPAYADSEDADPGYVPGPWHYHAITCVDTTVVSVLPILRSPGQTTFTAEDRKQAGAIVTFDTGLGITPVFASGQASITHPPYTPGNPVMTAEHAGDSVQVCYLGGPAPTEGCDPDHDNRGRKYRVFDYKQKQQYWGYNSNHLCGGA